MGASNNIIGSQIVTTRDDPCLCVMTFTIKGRIHPADVLAACERAEALIAASTAPAVECDLGALEKPSVPAVEAIALVQMAAVRRGRRFRIRGAPPGFLELVDVMGLEDVLVFAPD